MRPNLQLPLLLCGAVLAAGGRSLPAPPCPAEAADLVASGWRAFRADSIETARARFARADALCQGQFDAKVGLAYAWLRLTRVSEADSLFRLVTEADSLNGDAWDGLALTRWRLDDRSGALAAARRAVRLHPDNAATRELLDRLDADQGRRLTGRPPRRDTLRVDARTRGEAFEVPDSGSGWRRFYVQGVNLGVALPGRFPSEFPADSQTYAGWLDTLAAMHTNTVRVYTILPPTFYRALRGWNLTHPDRVLRLVHGVWAELPPGNDFAEPSWQEEFQGEMRRVVDLVHGNARIPPRPGHAAGLYDADVSRWTLGYLIGREWEPFAVSGFDRLHPGRAAYRGRYLATRGAVPAMDAWLAAQCDHLVSYEADGYQAIRPVAYTNWPTLDPLRHPTEATAAEERRFRTRAGAAPTGGETEYDNDAISVDAMRIRPTARNPAGWFASYHVYPYYPDFLLYDPGYLAARSSEGPSTFFGYLRALKRHHAGLPLLVAEYGVPSSRGVAHLQPNGWHHGGHDETAMARIDARLTREIREAGAAGGIVFAWLDEWFKHNWIVIDYELPADHTRRWHNLMNPEQHYGILGMYGEGENGRLGDSASGALGDWATRRLAEPSPDGAPGILLGADASRLHLTLEFPALAGQPFPWGDRRVLVALDTWRPDLGQRALPDGLLSGDIGFEFLAVLRDTAHAELRILPEYSPYVGPEGFAGGDDRGRFARRPVTTVLRDDGRFDSMFVVTNRARFTRGGRLIPTQGVNRGRLRYGAAGASSLNDWYWDREAGRLELRLPWNLLNVSDPSTRTVLFDESGTGPIGTARTDGVRVGVVITDGTGLRRLAAWPAPGPEGRWRAADFPSYQWPTWTEPRYHQRLKPVYDSLRALWDQ